jgi:hypothetical protein
MRTLIVLVILALIFTLAGWITFTKTEDETNIHLETQKMEQDAQEAVEVGKDIAEKTGEAIDRIREPEDDGAPSATEPKRN